jgi:hypothetical protein
MKIMKKRDLMWLFTGLGLAFIILTFLVSFYTLKVIFPNQIRTAAAFAETACYSISCYERSNITTAEYQQIQESCKQQTEEALALSFDSEQDIFFMLVTQNFSWILLIGIAFLIVAYIIAYIILKTEKGRSRIFNRFF